MDEQWCTTDGDYGDIWKENKEDWGYFDDWGVDGRSALVCPHCGCTQDCAVAPSAEIKFENGQPQLSTLGIGGEFRINKVGTYEGRNINIRITQTSEFDIGEGIVNNKGFVILNNPNKLTRDEWIDYRVQFLDDADEPIILPVSYFSAFDIEGPKNNKPESVRLRNDQVLPGDIFLHLTNPLETIPGDIYTQYKAVSSAMIPNPKDPNNLTEAQKQASLGFKLVNASEFYLGYQNVNAGRSCFLYSVTLELLTKPLCFEAPPTCEGDQFYSSCHSACPKICGQEPPVACALP
eukprot:UN31516